MKRQEKERRGWSEVRRTTGSVKKVRWEVKEKSNWSWMTGRKRVNRKENISPSFTGPSSEAGYCKKLSWCYTNLPTMILATSELACRVYDVYCSVQTVIYLHCCCCCYFFFIALDAAVTSFPQRTNTFILFLFFSFFLFKPNK